MIEKPTNTDLPDNGLTSDELLLQEPVKTHLDTRVDELDFRVTSELSAARHRAMANDSSSVSKNAARGSWFSWTNTIGTSAVLAVAVALGLQYYPSSTSPTAEPVVQTSQQALMEDLNLLSSSDDIEFYQSVEFLEWMESNAG